MRSPAMEGMENAGHPHRRVSHTSHSDCRCRSIRNHPQILRERQLLLSKGVVSYAS
jgi:hypothetical protein